MTDKLPDSTVSTAIHLAEKHSLPVQLIRAILQDYTECIRASLEKEIPFTINTLCKLYHSYDKPGNLKKHKKLPDGTDFYAGKVIKHVKFKLLADAEERLNGWVQDLGVKNNTYSELNKIQIKPDEIEKIRRRKTLEEQRSLGFRSDLLFDDPPTSDTLLERGLGPAPTIQEIADRIGLNLGV